MFSESSMNYLLKDDIKAKKNFKQQKILLKSHIFIFSEIQLIIVVFLIRDSFMS